MNRENHGSPAHAANPTKPETELAALAPLAPLADRVESASRDSQGRFLTGNSGGGRPKGSRNRLTDVFMSAIADDFAEHGAGVVARVRRGDPVTYLKIVGSFVPRELVVQRECEPNVDLDSLTLSELVALVEQAQRRSATRRALLDADRAY